jgi:hypothetical protein
MSGLLIVYSDGLDCRTSISERDKIFISSGFRSDLFWGPPGLLSSVYQVGLFSVVQTCSGAHPASCPMCTRWGSFLSFRPALGPTRPSVHCVPFGALFYRSDLLWGPPGSCPLCTLWGSFLSFRSVRGPTTYPLCTIWGSFLSFRPALGPTRPPVHCVPGGSLFCRSDLFWGPPGLLSIVYQVGLFSVVQTCSGAHPASCPMCTRWGSFLSFRPALGPTRPPVQCAPGGSLFCRSDLFWGPPGLLSNVHQVGLFSVLQTCSGAHHLSIVYQVGPFLSFRPALGPTRPQSVSVVVMALYY